MEAVALDLFLASFTRALLLSGLGGWVRWAEVSVCTPVPSRGGHRRMSGALGSLLPSLILSLVLELS